MRNNVRTILLAILSACASAGAAGCAAESGPRSGERPVTTLIVDISGSTQTLRQPGGQFERDWLATATQTAVNRGTLWASVADSNTVAHSTWEIPDKTFTPTIPDNETLARAELAKQAAALRPKAREMITRQAPGGSDLLGALQMAARLFRDYPTRPRGLVLLTDGDVNVGGLNLGRRPPRSETERQRLIARLRKSGQIADLTGGSGEPVDVWIGGLGHHSGKPDPRRIQALIEFWHDLVPAAKGRLVAEDSTLRLVDFP